MKKLLTLFLIIFMVSCQKKSTCVECCTIYTPKIIVPRIFEVCNDRDLLYWNGRTEDYYDNFGNHVTSVTTCNRNSIKANPRY